ncbi:MAG: nuclear transport factor 2 family protein [Gammaproteobacteria bacterium]|nr:nuclear transport factor 2 family protein [Gammaproteobacteria bacterium]
MSDSSALERRIDRLESRIAITELVSAYCEACDEHDIPRLAALFAEDAVYGSPSGVLVSTGRAEIAEMFVRAFQVRGPGFHWTHDLVINFDEESADRATGVVASHAETFVNRVPSLAAMKYDDEYRRVDGRWLFARRSIRFLYYVPAEKYLEALKSKRRLCFEGAWSDADYPESLPAWQEFERKYGG